MYLEKLQVQGIRNIRDAHLTLSSGANLIFGLNGSGKTSLLEAIHILSRGRSFRTRNLATVINNDLTSCTCFGLVNSDDGHSASIPVGVMRDSGGKFVFKVRGEHVSTASQLADVLPVQIVNSDSFELLEGSPGARRSFIDWGVFHVEHTYREIWSRFQKCLKQRNSLLRHGKIDALQLAVWDREFCSLASQIDLYRRHYLDRLIYAVVEMLSHLGLAGEFEFKYQPGWDINQDLQTQLQASLVRDQKSGHTNLGPHRADLRIQVGKQAAADILSRGQIKTLVFALKLAQGCLFEAVTGRKCIFLLDDLPAELDIYHRRAVCQQLAAMGVQVLVTGVDREDLNELWADSATHPAMFHVKQGVVSKV
jgi:DNA replication and repair protein RecF